MTTRLPVIIIILTVSSLLIIPYGMIAPAHAVATPTVFVSPGSMALAPANSLVTFNVSVSNMPAFGGWDIVVSVANPTILKPVSINRVENFSGTALTFSDCVNGVGQGCSSSDGGGVAHSAVSGSLTSSGNLTLFSVTFSSIASSGYTSISIQQDLGLPLLSDSSGNEIPVDVSGAVYGNAASGPIAVFSWTPVMPFVGEPVTFNASLSYDPSGGKIVSYYWPGKVTAQPITTFIFTVPGNQSVTLTVKDDKGLLSLPTTHFIEVLPPPCHPGLQTVQVPSECPTISSAIDAVVSGGTVLVAPGNYSEDVIVTKPVILRGAGRNSTFLKGSNPLCCVYDPSIGFYASNVSVSGFTISDSSGGGGAVDFYSSRDLLANNRIIGPVTVSNFSPSSVANDVLVNNTITDLEIRGSLATILSNNLINVLTIDSSPGCILRGNIIATFSISGSTVADYVEDIDASNKISGQPVYYVVGVSNPTIPADAGYLGLVNSSNINIGPRFQPLVGITLAGTQNVQINGVRVAGPPLGPGDLCGFSVCMGLQIAFSSNILIQNSTFEVNDLRLHPYTVLDNIIDSSNNTLVQNDTFLQSNLDFQDSNSITARHNSMLNGGISVSTSNGAEIMNNNFTANSLALFEFGVVNAGIYLVGSNESVVAHNFISDYAVGIWLLGSQSNLLEANVVQGERCLFCDSGPTSGMIFQDSPLNLLRNNQIIGAYASLQVFSEHITCFYNPAEPCQRLVDYAQDIDTSNTIDGRPIYYLVGAHDETVPNNAGYVAIVNSTRVTVDSINLSFPGDGIQIVASSDIVVEDTTVNATGFYQQTGLMGLDSQNLTLKNDRLTGGFPGVPGFGGVGISLKFCSNAVVEGNIIQTVPLNLRQLLLDGIRLVNTSNSTVEGNYVSDYAGVGITLTDSTDNTISRNTVLGSNIYSSYGILLEQTTPDSTSNLVIGNTIADNPVGLSASPGNTIYHNNFLDNVKQAQGPGNTWDNGAGQGNYWSDYTGQDLDGDGVGDTLLPHLGLDSYPLMSPWMPTGLSATLVGSWALSKHKATLSVTTGSVQTLSVSARNNGMAAEWIQAIFNITSANGQTQTVATLVWVPSGQKVVLSTPVTLSPGSYTISAQMRYSADALMSWTPVQTGPSA